MKQLLLICAVVALMGCLKKEPKQQAEANATATPKPELPKTEPKVEVKKPLTEEESAKIIEKAIRSKCG